MKKLVESSVTLSLLRTLENIDVLILCFLSIALSSSLSVPDSFQSVGTTDPSTLKKAIFWAYGTADYVPIDCEFLESSTFLLRCLQFEHRGHSIC
jgi:hypothetical protein